VANCGPPPIGVQRNNRTVLTADFAEGPKREAKLIDSGPLSENNPKRRVRVCNKGKSGLAPTSVIGQNRHGLSGKLLNRHI
jgi:hypothetical protein